MLPDNGDEEKTEPYEDEISPIKLTKAESIVQVISNQENNQLKIIWAIIIIVLVLLLFWILFAKRQK